MKTKKLSRRNAIAALFFGFAGTVIAQHEKKLKFAETLKSSDLAASFKFEPMWLTCSTENVKGVRIQKGGKHIEISMNEIWEALSREGTND